MPLKDDTANEILPFAPEGVEAAGDLVSMDEYKHLPARLRGFVSGVARRAIFNRVLRQLAHFSAGSAQFLANRHAAGVRDNGELDEIEEAWRSVIQGMIDAGAFAPLARKIATTAPLAGGDTLAKDITLSITAGAEGSLLTSVDGKPVWQIDTRQFAPLARKIKTTEPLAGGGPLESDLTLSIAAGTTGHILTSEGGKAAWKAPTIPDKYDLGEFYYFRHPTLKPGFQPAQGGLLANAATLYPSVWAYLQTVEGQKLCTTESQWQNMVNAVWHTNADGSRVGWNGIGGAPFYAPNFSTGALRLPDLRGMYAEAAGFDSLGVGGVHGDAQRQIYGQLFQQGDRSGLAKGEGVFHYTTQRTHFAAVDIEHNLAPLIIYFDASRVVPTAAKNQPRAWGSLACVYLGQPAS